MLAKKPHALNLQLLNYRFDNIFFRQNDTNQFSFAYYDSPMLRWLYRHPMIRLSDACWFLPRVFLKENVMWCIPKNPINLLWCLYIHLEISLLICISKHSWAIAIVKTTMFTNTPDNFPDFPCIAGPMGMCKFDLHTFVLLSRHR